MLNLAAMEEAQDHYLRYRRALGEAPLPAALVDLDALEANVDRIVAAARGRKLRLASKSVRSVELMRAIIDRARGAVGGLMTYAAAETLWLAQQGFSDLLLAYPTAHPADAAMLAEANRQASAAAAVDAVEQVEAIERAAEQAHVRVPLVVDVDVSYRPLGGVVHLGVRRSPLRSPEEVVALARRIAGSASLAFRGVLAYEAQIAGLPDFVPQEPLRTAALRAMKSRSRPQVAAARAAMAHALREAGLAPALFNGGGTGSLASGPTEEALTEVTVGSGFLCSHLFDHLDGLPLAPAIWFALQASRRPAPEMITCHGGGLIASGAPGADRLPLPALPAGLTLLPLEGAGEVQTPLRVPRGVLVALGAPVFFRPAKAGEPAERFADYALVRGDKQVGRARTYRGMGQCFG